MSSIQEVVAPAFKAISLLAAPPPFLGPKPEMTHSGDRRLNRSDGRSGGGVGGGRRLVKVVGVRAHLRQAGQLLVMSVFDAIFVHWWLIFLFQGVFIWSGILSRNNFYMQRSFLLGLIKFQIFSQRTNCWIRTQIAGSHTEYDNHCIPLGDLIFCQILK